MLLKYRKNCSPNEYYYLPKVTRVADGVPSTHVGVSCPLPTEVLSTVEDHLGTTGRRASPAIRALRHTARPGPLRAIVVLIARQRVPPLRIRDVVIISIVPAH